MPNRWLGQVDGTCVAQEKGAQGREKERDDRWHESRLWNAFQLRHNSTEYGRTLGWVHGLEVRVFVGGLGNLCQTAV